MYGLYTLSPKAHMIVCHACYTKAVDSYKEILCTGHRRVAARKNSQILWQVQAIWNPTTVRGGEYEVQCFAKGPLAIASCQRGWDSGL